MGREAIKGKKVYRPLRSLEVFYTGGDVEQSRSGFLACSCTENVKLVDAASGSVVRTLTADEDGEPITALALRDASNPAASRVFAASRSLQLHCWDATTGRKIRSWRGHKGPVLDMAVSGGGHHMATAGADGTIRIWDTEGLFCTHLFQGGHKGIVGKVVWQSGHQGDMRIMSGGDDGIVCIWDLLTKSRITSFKAHASHVTVLALTGEGRTLVTAGRDKLVHVWDIRREPVKVTSFTPYEIIEGLAIINPGQAFPGVDKRQGKKNKPREASQPVSFVTVGERGQIRVWNTEAGSKPSYELNAAGQSPPAPGEGLAGIAMRPEGGVLISTDDGRLLMYDVSEGGLELARQLVGNLDQVTDACFVGPPTEPAHVAVATNSAVPRLFDVANLSCTASLTGHTDIVLGLDSAVSGKGQVLLATCSKDMSVRVWDTASGDCLAAGTGHIAAVSVVAFARRNAKFLVSGGVDKMLRVWDVAGLLAGSKSTPSPAQGKEKALQALTAAAAHDKDINGIAVSPNDALICTASQDRTAKIWRMPDLVLSTTLRGHRRGVWACAFSPVDPVVATAGGDALLRLWSLSDGACLKTFEGHEASVLRVCFLSRGTQIVSSSSDAKLKLWSVRTTECTATFDAHDGKVWALAVAGVDESMLVSGGEDGKLCLWQDCTVSDEDAAAAEAAAAVHKQQQLANALQAEDFTAAAQLAFELGQPRRLLAVVEAVRARGPEAAAPILATLAAGLDPTRLKQCLEFVREWNTNSRHCHAAHAVLQAIFLHHPPEALVSVAGISQLVEGLAGYSQRHAARLDRLLRASHLLDYTLAASRVLQPPPQEGGILRIADGTNGVATPELAGDTPVRLRLNGRGVYPRPGAGDETPSFTTDESDDAQDADAGPAYARDGGATRPAAPSESSDDDQGTSGDDRGGGDGAEGSSGMSGSDDPDGGRDSDGSDVGDDPPGAGESYGGAVALGPPVQDGGDSGPAVGAPLRTESDDDDVGHDVDGPGAEYPRPTGEGGGTSAQRPEQLPSAGPKKDRGRGQRKGSKAGRGGKGTAEGVISDVKPRKKGRMKRGRNDGAAGGVLGPLTGSLTEAAEKLPGQKGKRKGPSKDDSQAVGVGAIAGSGSARVKKKKR